MNIVEFYAQQELYYIDLFVCFQQSLFPIFTVLDFTYFMYM